MSEIGRSNAKYLLILPAALYVPAPITGFRWYFASIAIMLAVSVGSTGRIRSGMAYITAPLAIWMAVNFASAGWADDPYVATISSAYVLILASFLLGGAALLANSNAYVASGIFAYTTIAIAVAFSYVIALYGSVRPTTEAVANLFGAGANAGAMHCAVGLPILLWRCSVRRSIGNYVLVAIAVLCILFAQSRAGYMAAAVAVTLWLIGRTDPRRTLGSKLVATSLLLGGLAILAVAFAPTTIDRLVNVALAVRDPTLLVAEGQGDFSRLATYYFGWLAFISSPVLGIGFHNLQSFMEAQVGFGEGSHNLIVTLLAETGLPGAAAFTLLLYRFFRRINCAISAPQISIHEADWWIAIRAAMITTLVVSMFHQLPEFQYFYVLLGFVAVSTAVARTRAKA